MNRTITVINLLLGVAVIALLALIFTGQISVRLFKGLQPGGAPSPAVSASSTPLQELTYYAPILANGLFGPASKGTLAAVVTTPQGGAPLPATAPSELLLLGTVVGSPRESFALVKHSGKQEERVFRLGEMVFEAGRLAEVRPEMAFIVVNGKKVELLTPMTPPASQSLPKGGAKPAAGGTPPPGLPTAEPGALSSISGHLMPLWTTLPRR